MNNWFVGFAMGLLTLLAYEKLQEDPPPEVDIPSPPTTSSRRTRQANAMRCAQTSLQWSSNRPA
jgi:hypothetical protein